MSLIEWSDAYALGNPMIDTQHKELFSLVNLLHEAIKNGDGEARSQAVYESLKRYCVGHFLEEEQLMERVGYPGCQAHKEHHDRFRHLVFGGEKVSPLALVQFISNWIKGHILEVDTSMVQWMNAHPRLPEVYSAPPARLNVGSPEPGRSGAPSGCLPQNPPGDLANE